MAGDCHAAEQGREHGRHERDGDPPAEDRREPARRITPADPAPSAPAGPPPDPVGARDPASPRSFAPSASITGPEPGKAPKDGALCPLDPGLERVIVKARGRVEHPFRASKRSIEASPPTAAPRRTAQSFSRSAVSAARPLSDEGSRHEAEFARTPPPRCLRGSECGDIRHARCARGFHTPPGGPSAKSRTGCRRLSTRPASRCRTRRLASPGRARSHLRPRSRRTVGDQVVAEPMTATRRTAQRVMAHVLRHRIAEHMPLPEEMEAPHRLRRHRPAPALRPGLGIMRLDQREEPGPGLRRLHPGAKRLQLRPLRRVAQAGDGGSLGCRRVLRCAARPPSKRPRRAIFRLSETYANQGSPARAIARSMPSPPTDYVPRRRSRVPRRPPPRGSRWCFRRCLRPAPRPRLGPAGAPGPHAVSARRRRRRSTLPTSRPRRLGPHDQPPGGRRW
jgi:hypothetical protein